MLGKGSIEPVSLEPIICFQLFLVPQKDSVERRLVVVTLAPWTLISKYRLGSHSETFLALQVEDQAFCFQVMSFRLNITPMIFTKLVTILVKELRAKTSRSLLTATAG